MLEITVGGNAALVERLRNAPRKIRKIANEEVERTALRIHTRAKRLAPVDTGYLRNSISNKSVGFMQQEVQARAEYAALVNYGPSNWRGQPFVDEGGSANNRPRRGRKGRGGPLPNPFFTSAVEQHAPKLEQNIRSKLRGSI
jgi:HK97 gp10 family phage protein